MPPTDDGPRASFRDPEGQVIVLEDRVLRTLTPEAADRAEDLLASEVRQRYEAEDSFVATKQLSPEQARRALDGTPLPGSLQASQIEAALEHERIPFPNYPHEWPPTMLHAAGELTIELARDLADEGRGLKDATPLNVMFHGPTPTFIDFLSLEERHPRDPTWLASAQFQRTFLIPLLLYERLGLQPAELLLARRDGVPPEEAYGMLGPIRRLLPPDLGLVTLPTWFGEDELEVDRDLYETALEDDPDKAAFIYDRTLAKEAKRLAKVAPETAPGESHWEDYLDTCGYDEDQLATKRSFVRSSLENLQPDWVLDAGCNTGAFSEIAAEAGACVVAADAAPTVVDRTYARALDKDLDVLPLVVDLSRPTPATGWANEETPSFLERAEDRFDCVFMLALVHHLHVSEQVPLTRIVDLAAHLTRDALVIEYVGPEDERFQALAKGREHLHAELTPKRFEAALEQRFRIEDQRPIEGTDRRLYLAREE